MAPEGFDPTTAPTRRGRRDPDLAAQLAMTDNGNEPQHSDVDELPLLADGDVVGAKATIDITIDGKESWFTYEARTRIWPGETEEEANERIALIVNVRAVELADDMEARLLDRAAAKQRAPIVPR